MADDSYQGVIHTEQGGLRQVVPSGGSLDIESGGEIDIESGGALKIAGSALTVTAAEINETIISIDVADLSAEATYYMVMPHAGTISKIWSVIDGSVATADVTLTFNIGATPITGGVVTIATAGSAAGDVDSATPSAANVVTAGQAINFVVTGGGAGGSPRGHVYVVLTR